MSTVRYIQGGRRDDGAAITFVGAGGLGYEVWIEGRGMVGYVARRYHVSGNDVEKFWVAHRIERPLPAWWASRRLDAARLMRDES